jgi:hypothetical protein
VHQQWQAGFANGYAPSCKLIMPFGDPERCCSKAKPPKKENRPVSKSNIKAPEHRENLAMGQKELVALVLITCILMSGGAHHLP